jgi:hypothetical protein
VNEVGKKVSMVQDEERMMMMMMRLYSIDGERTIGIGCSRGAHRQQVWEAGWQIWPSGGASVLIRSSFRLGGEDSERVGIVENGCDLAHFCMGGGHWRRGAWWGIASHRWLSIMPSWRRFWKMKGVRQWYCQVQMNIAVLSVPTARKQRNKRQDCKRLKI